MATKVFTVNQDGEYKMSQELPTPWAKIEACVRLERSSRRSHNKETDYGLIAFKAWLATKELHFAIEKLDREEILLLMEAFKDAIRGATSNADQ